MNDNKEEVSDVVTSEDVDSDIKRLFKVRKVIKGKKPKFNRYCHHKFKRLSKSWRRPRGLQSKQRRGIYGKGPIVSVGYGSPKLVKGLHPSGYDEFIIYNENELSLVSSEFEAIRIASSVGNRKKQIILAKAKDMNIKVLNPGLKKEI